MVEFKFTISKKFHSKKNNLSKRTMSTEPETRNWLELPLDVTTSILTRLGTIEILSSVQNVCSLWRNICKDPSMWRSIDMRNSGEVWDKNYDLDKMCAYAVDRSCGHLININLEYFVTDELLIHIAERSSHLKRLRLVSCYDVSDRGLSVAASKLLFLEDLEISYCSITKDALETVGRCCPHLKSLKFNIPGCRHYIGSDDEALAIAQSMPELRHLQLFGNKLTNDGLKSILDGCPHLESLDLRQCFNVSLQGDLEKRCVEQIKNLRCPSDSTRDYEFDAQVYGSDYPSEISDIDLYDDYDDYFEFSGASDFSDYDEEYSFFD